MKSTEQIHQIIEQVDHIDNVELMRRLKDLRVTVADETKRQIMREVYNVRGAMTKQFNTLRNHYNHGT
jgi:hypothetical protein